MSAAMLDSLQDNAAKVGSDLFSQRLRMPIQCRLSHYCARLISRLDRQRQCSGKLREYHAILHRSNY